MIFTNYRQPEGKSLCEIGLKSGAQLQREGVDFGRTMIHDYIFLSPGRLSLLLQTCSNIMADIYTAFIIHPLVRKRC